MIAQARASRIARSAAAAILLLSFVPAPARAQKIPALEPLPGHRVGNLAPEFVLRDLNDRQHDLKEMRGKQVVHVVFWATWCVPCLQEIPTLRATQEKYRDRGLQVLGIVVTINQTEDGVRAAARDLKVNYPILWDDGGAIQERYRVSSIPANFLIGKDGVIRYAGSTLPTDYEALVDSLLRGAGAARAAGRTADPPPAH